MSWYIDTNPCGKTPYIVSSKAFKLYPISLECWSFEVPSLIGHVKLCGQISGVEDIRLAYPVGHTLFLLSQYKRSALNCKLILSYDNQTKSNVFSPI